MIIIGVDPGTIRTGYGVISFGSGEYKIIGSGVIHLQKFGEIPPRLNVIYTELRNIIGKYRPQEFAIETAFYGKNFQSALKIGYAKGAAILACMHAGLYPSEYSPREVKKSVTGTGAATKDQVNYMVRKILHSKNDMIYDESDALAIAICHAGRVIKNTSVKRSWKSFVEENPERIVK